MQLLTTRQVQSLLKVDRITIYRMLQDGRIKGVKIGQQWRFHEGEVNRLIQPGDPADQKPTPTPPLPVHCLQTIQNLFTQISQLGAVVTTLEGELVTSPTSACSLCQMLLDNPASAAASRESWKRMAQESSAGQRQFTCDVGLTYLSAPVMDGDAPAAWLLAGQVFLNQPSFEAEENQAEELSRRFALPLSPLSESLRHVPVIPAERHAQLHAWVLDASRAMSSILQERAGFLQRMRQIADLTQVE